MAARRDSKGRFAGGGGARGPKRTVGSGRAGGKRFGMAAADQAGRDFKRAVQYVAFKNTGRGATARDNRRTDRAYKRFTAAGGSKAQEKAEARALRVRRTRTLTQTGGKKWMPAHTNMYGRQGYAYSNVLHPRSQGRAGKRLAKAVRVRVKRNREHL